MTPQFKFIINACSTGKTKLPLFNIKLCHWSILTQVELIPVISYYYAWHCLGVDQSGESVVALHITGNTEKTIENIEK